MTLPLGLVPCQSIAKWALHIEQQLLKQQSLGMDCATSLLLFLPSFMCIVPSEQKLLSRPGPGLLPYNLH